MKKIASFEVDHTNLDIGMYTSRVDGDIITYDVRMVKPNADHYLSNASIHTIEHLFATFARNTSRADDVIYVGPMGCRTGFYFICRDKLTPKKAISLVYDCLKFVSEFEGEIPGTTEIECGNYKEHDLNSAKKDVLPILKKLENYSEKQLVY